MKPCKDMDEMMGLGSMMKTKTRKKKKNKIKKFKKNRLPYG